MKIRADYHLHTARCKHATGTMEAYVEQAIQLGLEEIAFTDHIPLPDEFDIDHRMARSELDEYLKEITDLKKTYPEISILTGIEADYYEGFESYTDDILSQYPFDIVLMAVHFLRHWPDGNWAFGYQFPGKSMADIYSDYLATVIRGIRTGLFDVVAHVDLIKKAGYPIFDHARESFIEVLREVRQANMAIEINTSGRRKNINEFFPSNELWELIFEQNLPITIGSDAHSPSQVGLCFDMVAEHLPVSPVQFNQRKMSNLALLPTDTGKFRNE